MHGIAKQASRQRHVVTAWLCLVAASAVACSSGPAAGGADRTAVAPAPNGKLFTLMPASFTGVRFENQLVESRDLNVFTYRNFYNGGGVAIGDLTGDGRPELVLTANQGGARLFLNEGGFRFRDVTREAGLDVKRVWTTGVAMADVDGDGRLDLYICHAGQTDPAKRANALWINRGLGSDSIPRFDEQGEKFGVADRGYSTHAAFLDHDRDGDLDLFIINNSPRPVTSFGQRNTRHVRDSHGGHKLYRNDNGHFTDVSAAAGIFGSEIGFGLGVGVSDVNRDGWADVWVSNDFFERDYLYINRGDGTFDEVLDRQLNVGSYFSMGMDLGDVDNDGWPDAYTTDMLPEDEYRLRTMASFEGWDVYHAKLRNGYHHQLMRNMLQRNNGDGTFTEVGQMAGVARTDWSWSALIADLDLDGLKDIFVTNGLVRDVTSQDYIAFLANESTMDDATRGGSVDYMKLIGAMPSTKLSSYAFQNQGALSFRNAATAWGLDTPAFSSGASYGDLDGDGAPDLVVNTVNGEAFVYRNNARSVTPDRHFLQVQLEGEGRNRLGVGARVSVSMETGDSSTTVTQELFPSRGFQSSVDYVLTFGLGACDTVARVTVEWPDGRRSEALGVAANQRLTLRHADAVAAPPPVAPTAAIARLVAVESDTLAVPAVHRENEFVDFDRERLIPKLLSTEGPALAVADVDGDGRDDVYLGAAKEQGKSLLLQRENGRFVRGDSTAFAADAISEDVGATFFDADGDGDRDLYVVSGGNEYSDLAPALQDRLYLNDGRGRFTRASGALPDETVSGSRAVAADYDGDGDLDLFVGGRVVPWRYGEDPTSLLLRNDGRGHFANVIAERAPELERVGMVTDAAWQDLDGDRRPELIVVGEWMPITVFRNAGGGRLVRQAVAGLDSSAGWWNRIVATDVDADGRIDFVVGNLGLNTRLRATPAEPATLVVKDFDGNGFLEPVVACYSQGKLYPLVLRDDMIRAIPPLKARYLNYIDYAKATLSDVFPDLGSPGVVRKVAQTFATSIVHNEGNGRFRLVPLPAEAQVAPVYGIVARDLNADGRTDLLMAGNFDGFKPEIGRASESQGVTLLGDGRGGFTPLRGTESGFRVRGQVRGLEMVRGRGTSYYLAALNNDRPVLFRASEPHVATSEGKGEGGQP